MKTENLRCCVALFLLAASLGCSKPTVDPAPEAARPGVLLYLIDTLRSDRVGALGYGRPTTPALDALAAQGIVFEQAYAPGPWTLPSVVSLMLSQPMCRHGVVVDGKKIDREAIPLAEVMRRAGYRTASFIANSYAGRPSGLERGFEICEGPVDNPAQRVAQFLEAGPGTPFFVYVHDVRPHDPHEASAEYLARFGDVSPATLKRLKNRTLRYRRLTRVDHVEGSSLGSTDNTLEQREALRRLDKLAESYGHAYDARIREADDMLAATLEQLRLRGLLEDTVVIVVSDHGEELGDHGGWLHDQSVYEELVRAPLVVRLPEERHAGRRIETPVSLLDVAPTIAGLAGATVSPGNFEGRSLLPLLESEATGKREPFVPAMRMNVKKHYRPWKRRRGDQNVVVREGDWKAIWNVEPDSVELYDLRTDPGERVDLRAREPDRAARLGEFARDYLAKCEQRKSHPVTRGALSRESRERLRVLGYVD